MLINVLGCDGCGKSTQIEKLINWAEIRTPYSARSLAKRDIFDTSTFPECDFFGCEYDKLAHQLLPQMKGEARALWLIYMNAVLIKSAPAKPGEIVFLDGFWHKHYATEAALGVDKAWLLDVCAFFPEPDITVLLDLGPERTVARNHQHRPYESGCDFDCKDESFIAHQEKVRALLLDLAETRGYQVIDADRSVDEIFDSIVETISNNLSARFLA
jgi:thymidylate kinase